jgi:cold shock CspA family protein
MKYDQVLKYGFVRGDGGQQYFIHRTEFVDDLTCLWPGDMVEFTPTMTPRGLRATTIRRRDDAPEEERARG